MWTPRIILFTTNSNSSFHEYHEQLLELLSSPGLMLGPTEFLGLTLSTSSQVIYYNFTAFVILYVVLKNLIFNFYTWVLCDITCWVLIVGAGWERQNEECRNSERNELQFLNWLFCALFTLSICNIYVYSSRSKYSSPLPHPSHFT